MLFIFPLDNVQLSFRDALEQVYGENLYSAHDRSMKYELNYGDSNMERVVGFLFHRRSICDFFCYKSIYSFTMQIDLVFFLCSLLGARKALVTV